MKAHLLFESKASLGEGPVWLPGKNELMWVDINMGEVHCYRYDSHQDTVIYHGNKPSCIFPLTNDNFLIADTNRLLTFDRTTGESGLFLEMDFKDENIRFNDGKIDPYGFFWIGTMHMNIVPNKGSLYRVDAQKNFTKELDGVTISNGIAWSHDAKTMFYIDSYENAVFAFDFNSNSEISNRRRFMEFKKEEGAPDGMTIDTRGYLWIAMWGGHSVLCCDPGTGKMIDKIKVEAPNVTSCTLAGKSQDLLLITTARDGLSREELRQYPLSGSLFQAKIPCKY